MSPVTVDQVVAAGKATSLTMSVVQEWAQKATPTQRRFLYGMLTAENDSRLASRRTRLLKAARLPALKTLAGYDFNAVTLPAGYDQGALTGLEFASNAENLVLYGDVGTGKTHLAIALATQACEQGIAARFFTTAALVMHLRRAKADGRLDRELAHLARNQILVIDEFGYLPIDTEGARLLFQIIAESYEKRSLIITTNLEFSRWGTVFGDDQMAAAAIDRIIHHGRLLQFTGTSYRLTHTLMKTPDPAHTAQNTDQVA